MSLHWYDLITLICTIFFTGSTEHSDQRNRLILSTHQHQVPNISQKVQDVVIHADIVIIFLIIAIVITMRITTATNDIMKKNLNG